jgi:homoserine dehydrogenase
MDVEGYDTAIKMIILTNYFFDSQITLKDVDIVGISNISKEVINRVKDSGGKIKLLGKTYRENNEIKIKVSPEILNVEHSLYSVDRKNKGILFNTDVLGNITIIGGASGVENAAASIVRDITNLK